MFGFEMGTGARTYVPAAAPYLIIIAVVLFGEGAVPGLATGAAFGLCRGLVVADRSLHRNRAGWDAALERRQRLLPLIGLATAVPLIILLATSP